MRSKFAAAILGFSLFSDIIYIYTKQLIKNFSKSVLKLHTVYLKSPGFPTGVNIFIL